MALRIVLHANPDTVYPTGTTIAGHIELTLKHSSQRQALEKVNLSFSARSKARITKRRGPGSNSSTHVYSSKSLLFTHTYTLAVNQFTPNPEGGGGGGGGGTLNWPFEIHVPTNAESIPPHILQARDADVFEPAGPFPGTTGYGNQALPSPPHSLPDSLPRFFMHNGLHTDLEASVRYKLRAEVEGLRAGAAAMWMGNKGVEVDIPVLNTNPTPSVNTGTGLESDGFGYDDDDDVLPSYTPAQTTSPSSAIPQPQPQLNYISYDSTVRTLRLLPQHQERKLSLRERTRSVFKRSSLPAVTLRITFACPRTIYLHRPLEEALGMAISVRRVPNDSTSGDGSHPSSPTTAAPAGAGAGAGLGFTHDEFEPNPQPHRSQSGSSAIISAQSSSLLPQDSTAAVATDNHDDEDDNDNSEIPTPQVTLKKLTVSLVAITQVRTAAAGSVWDRAYKGASFTPATIFTWKAKDGGTSLPVPVDEYVSAQNGNAAGESEKAALARTRSGSGSVSSTPGTTWFDLTRKLGATLRYVHDLDKVSNFGLVSDFATPNLARGYRLEWEVRLDVCGEDVRWRTGAMEGGPGVGVFVNGGRRGVVIR